MTTLTRYLDVLHVKLTDPPEELRAAVELILAVEYLDASSCETLVALATVGPLADGEVPSKPGRDALVQLGFASRILVKGIEGFAACTNTGARAYRVLCLMRASNPKTP